MALLPKSERSDSFWTLNCHRGAVALLTGNRSVDEVAGSALRRFQARVYKRAVTRFEEAALHHGQGQLKEAAELYDQVLEADPNHVGAAFRLGSILLQLDQSRDAVVLLQRAAWLDSSQPAFHLSLGEARRRLGQFTEAAESFMTSMALDPEFVAPVFRLGILLREVGELDAAVACLERAAQGNLAASELSSELEAARAARKAASARPEPAWQGGSAELAMAAFLRLASNERARGRQDAAVALCERALRRQPADVPTLVCLAEALEELECYERAIDHFREASAREPHDSSLSARLAAALGGRTIRQRIRELFANGTGLEIGGPSALFRQALPVYEVAHSIDGVNFANETIWEGTITEGRNYNYSDGKQGLQFVCEASRLHTLEGGRYDFLLASHCLEHCANAIATLQEWTRVVRTGGVLLLVLPDKRFTFDHRRATTSFEHLLEDYQQGVDETDLTHLDEVLELHDLGMDPPAGDAAQFRQRSVRNFENRCLHHHVFDFQLLDALLSCAGIDPILHFFMNPIHQVVIGIKR
jgi:tetratricopeptide (TPR) repeat protein